MLSDSAAHSVIRVHSSYVSTEPEQQSSKGKREGQDSTDRHGTKRGLNNCSLFSSRIFFLSISRSFYMASQQMPLPSISTLKRGGAFDSSSSTAAPHYPTPPYSSPASEVNSEHGGGGGGGPMLRRSPRRHHRADHHGMMTPVVPHEELASMLDNYLDEGGGEGNYNQNNGQRANYYSYSPYHVSSSNHEQQQSFNYGYAQQQQQQHPTSFQQHSNSSSITPTTTTRTIPSSTALVRKSLIPIPPPLSRLLLPHRAPHLPPTIRQPSITPTPPPRTSSTIIIAAITVPTCASRRRHPRWASHPTRGRRRSAIIPTQHPRMSHLRLLHPAITICPPLSTRFSTPWTIPMLLKLVVEPSHRGVPMSMHPRRAHVPRLE